MSNAQIELVQLGERKYVGVAVTCSFQNVKGVGEARQSFMNRIGEIQSVVDENKYVCVHYANAVLFTYIYCMEVTDLQTIPEGMIGFEVPGNQYVKVQTNGEEPYGLIDQYLKDKGLQNNTNSVSREVFEFGKEESKYNAEILVPVSK